MEIIDKREQATLAVRTTTAVKDLPSVLGQVYGEIAGYMGKTDIPFAGPPFAMYHNMDMENLDVEIGFPVAGKVSGEGRIKAGKLPGGRTLAAKHTGPYATIEETYNDVTAFLKEKNLETEIFMYEEYLNSPEDTPPEKLETNIYFPLKG